MVIIHPSTAADGFARKIRDVGIPAINIDFSTYATMNQAYAILGEVLGGEYERKLERWRLTTESRIAKARELTSGIPEAERPVVFYIAGQSDSLITTMAGNSIVNDWVTSAGGRYAPALMNLTGNEVTPEALFALNPDLIICGGVWQHVLKNAVETTAGWRDLNAVRSGRVYNNPYACFNWDRFGLESQLQINYALMCIQPEIAAANDINRQSMLEEIVNFYLTYTDYELTAEQAEYMLDGLTPFGLAEIPVN